MSKKDKNKSGEQPPAVEAPAALEQAPSAPEAPVAEQAPASAPESQETAPEAPTAPVVVEPTEPVEPSAPVASLPPKKPKTLEELSARRKQVMIDLSAVRKQDDGHEHAKALEKELEQIDRDILPLKEEVIRKQEKLKAAAAIGRVAPPAVAKSKIESPPSSKVIVDSQIPELFKLKVKAPTTVAFDLVKICSILEEAARELYFAHDARKPVMQESIKILAKLSEEICEAIKEDEEERLVGASKDDVQI